jgi:transcriptional regulator with XRE-family HTH domain
LKPVLDDARLVLTGEQCRDARALLRMPREDLARKAHLYLATVEAFENGTKSTSFPTRSKLRGALESAGVAFTDDGVGLKPEALKSNRS